MAHLGIAALAGLGLYARHKWLRKEDWTLAGAIGSAVGGAFAGCLPDILEPACSPNHRGVGHGLALLGLIGFVAKNVLQNPDLTPETKLSVLIGCAGYASHLGADAFTPKGLPLLS
jgi:membrane-bound metal-dependent hydrolase YbcI (DUF457 family)